MATTVVKHRAGWKYFIVDTERWLDSLAAEGLHISEIDFSGNHFVFTLGEAEKCRHCFSYKKYPGSSVTDAKTEEVLEKHGWRKLCHDERWSLYKTVNTSELNVLPNRRGIYLRNNSLLLIYNILSFVLLLAALGGCFAYFAFGSADNRFDESFFRHAVMLAVLFGLLVLLNFLVFLKLSGSNKKIIEDFGASINPEYALYRHFVRNFTFEKWLEKLLVKEGDIIRMFHPIWLTAPDKFEDWLSRHEAEGLNYYKTGRAGCMQFFTKGTPRGVKYAIVNNRISDLDETRRFLEDDWKILYYTPGQIGKYMLLAKSYSQGEEPPLFFSDGAQLKTNARVITLKYLLFLSFLFIADALWFILNYYLFRLSFGGFIALAVLLITLYAVARLIFYYLRVCRSVRHTYIRAK